MSLHQVDSWHGVQSGIRARDKYWTAIREVNVAVRQAHRVQKDWAATDVARRCEVARRARDWVVAKADTLAATVARHAGKTCTDALSTEVLPAALTADHFAKHAPALLRERRVGAGSTLLARKRSSIHRTPFGVIGLVAPRPCPFLFSFAEALMAWVAGNAVVLNLPSEARSLGRQLERCFREAGLANGLFSYIDLPDELAGEALLDAGVNKLLFAGSAGAGRRLMARAAQTLTPVGLRLGGNDPMLVCPDVDVERAAAGAVWAGMQNYGRSQNAVKRIYVHHEVHRRFVNHVVDRVRVLRLGRSNDMGVDVGVDPPSDSLFEVRDQVEDALAKGAVIEGEPEDLDAMFATGVPPTVLTRVDHSMRLMREESWGPVIGVMSVQDMDEAVELANDSDHALTASVWSRSRRTAQKLAQRIVASVVTINDHLTSNELTEVPWRGFNFSRLECSHGDGGLLAMTEPHCIVEEGRPGLHKHLPWHLHDLARKSGLNWMFAEPYAPGLPARLAALRRLATELPRVFQS